MRRIVPHFLVILAAFNGVGFLRQQIKSILEQSNVQVSIVISVDQSTDGTEALVESMAARDDRISWLPFGRIFGGAAPNFFRLLNEINVHGFDYLSLADQDDIWEPQKLIRAHEEMKRTGASGYSSNVTAFWASGKRALIKKSQPQQRWDFLFEGPGPGCTFALNRRLALACQTTVRGRLADLSAVGFHDWFIYALARAQGHRWHIDEQPGMLYRQHDRNQLGVNVGLRPWLRRVAKITSGWGFGQARLTARLVGMAGDPFVTPWVNGQRLGLIVLALQCAQCRRRIQDRVLFALSCLWMAIYLPNRQRPW